MMTPVMNSENIVTEFTDKVLSRHNEAIIKIILFGSRAKGVFRPDSDYDFLIVLRKADRAITDDIYDLVTDFMLDYGVDISLKIYREEKYQSMAAASTPFFISVMKTGRELWNNKHVS